MYARLLAESPLASATAKECLARTVRDCEIQIRGMMALVVRNADEERALVQAHQRKLKALDALKLTTAVADDDEEDL